MRGEHHQEPRTEEQRRRLAAMKPLEDAMKASGRVQKKWLAEHADVSLARLCQYLKGRYRWPEQTFRRICFLLKVEPEQVLGLEPAALLLQSERTERLARKRFENKQKRNAAA